MVENEQQAYEAPLNFEPLLNDEQTGHLLGDMHPKTLQRLARMGKIPSHKIGRFWFFRASELDSWLASGDTVECDQPSVPCQRRTN